MKLYFIILFNILFDFQTSELTPTREAQRQPYHVYFKEKYKMNYNITTKQGKLNEYRRVGKILKKDFNFKY